MREIINTVGLMEDVGERSPLKLVESDPRKQQRAGRMMANSAFRAWFGQSMVHDQDNLPFMYCHGTGTAFTAFRPTGENGVQIGKGIYVATRSTEAEHYASHKKTPQIMLLYVSAQHIVSAKWLWTALADGVFVHHLSSTFRISGCQT